MANNQHPIKKKLKVILDSNAFYVPLQFKLDIFEELGRLMKRNYEPILLSPVLNEIQKHAETGSPKLQKEAAYALQLAKRCKLVEVSESCASVDDAIVNTSQKLGCPVFTNDALLRRRLRDINMPVIYVRHKSRLEIDGRL